MKSFLKLWFVFAAMFTIGQVTAQTQVHVTIIMNDGTTQVYDLDENCQINFGSEEYLWIIRPDNKESIQITLDDIRKITFEDLADVTENDSNAIGIYPNPVGTQFIINGLEETKTIRIYAIDGRLVRQNQVENGQHIDVSNLEAGLYLINIGGQNLKMIKL